MPERAEARNEPNKRQKRRERVEMIIVGFFIWQLENCLHNSQTPLWLGIRSNAKCFVRRPIFMVFEWSVECRLGFGWTVETAAGRMVLLLVPRAHFIVIKNEIYLLACLFAFNIFLHRMCIISSETTISLNIEKATKKRNLHLILFLVNHEISR